MTMLMYERKRNHSDNDWHEELEYKVIWTSK